MIRFLMTIGALSLCSACVHTADYRSEDADYTRVEYLETVFQPASEACRRAGGFMIFEDPADPATRLARLSYSDMRLAMARGCAGI